VFAFGTAEGFIHRFDHDTRVAFRLQAFAAAERNSPLLFDRNETGELGITSQCLAMLLGKDHEERAEDLWR